MAPVNRDPRIRDNRANQGPRRNQDIRVRTVQVIDDAGTNRGTMDTRDALRLAEDNNLDLVEINPTAVPPICKIMDYGKFRYEQKAKEKEAKKNQTVNSQREVHFSPGVEENDFARKLQQARAFLEKGEKVRLVIQPKKGRFRDMLQKDVLHSLMARAVEAVKDLGTQEKPAVQEGRNFACTINPMKK